MGVTRSSGEPRDGIFKAWLRCPMVLAAIAGGSNLRGLGETEPGSAGTQPGKGYPGRRCADGASDPGLPIAFGVAFIG